MKKGDPVQGHPGIARTRRARYATRSLLLEVELDRELDDAMAQLLGGDTELVVGKLAGRAVEIKVEVVGAVAEAPQRVVHKVIRREAQLQLPGLAELEVFEQRQVAVEKCGSGAYTSRTWQRFWFLI